MIRQLLFVTAIAAVAQPAFEVASVRPSAHSGDGMKGGPVFVDRFVKVDAGRFSATGVNLLTLVLRAYGISACRPLGEGTCLYVAGGPDWLQKDHFDVEAKIPDGAPVYDQMQLQTGHAPELALMLQNLLADRFHFKAHRETRELPIYSLTVSKKGHKLKPPASSDPGKIYFRGTESNGERMIQLVGTNSTTAELCNLYSMFMERPLVDQTGLKDKFDFTATYESNPLAPGPFSELSSPSVFRAFQDQLGLKVEATKGPVEILIIDHAERPSAN